MALSPEGAKGRSRYQTEPERTAGRRGPQTGAASTARGPQPTGHSRGNKAPSLILLQSSSFLPLTPDGGSQTASAMSQPPGTESGGEGSRVDLEGSGKLASPTPCLPPSDPHCLHPTHPLHLPPGISQDPPCPPWGPHFWVVLPLSCLYSLFHSHPLEF